MPQQSQQSQESNCEDIDNSKMCGNAEEVLLAKHSLAHQYCSGKQIGRHNLSGKFGIHTLNLNPLILCMFLYGSKAPHIPSCILRNCATTATSSKEGTGAF
jgi:hypothetical protein